MDQPGVRLSILLLVVSSTEGKMNVSLCLCSRLRIWSRETGSAVPSRARPLILLLRLNLIGWCLLTGFLPISAAAASVYFNHHTPSGHSRVCSEAVAYRWRSLSSRVRRHSRAILNVVPVTGAAAFASPWTNYRAPSLVPRPLLLVGSGPVEPPLAIDSYQYSINY